MAAIRKTLAGRLSQFVAGVSSSSPAIPRRPFHNPSAVSGGAGRMSLPTGDRLVEQIRGLNPPRLNLDGLVPPRRPPEEAAPAPESAEVRRAISVAEVRKVLRASRMEEARARVRASATSVVSFDDFVKMCGEDSIARSLDEAGDVVVLGDAVFLRPQEVAKAIENMIPDRNKELQRRELDELEKKKAVIDNKASNQVKRELWGGLGYLVLQTAAFMRLTFWELSWDVMEPICFYVTSMYFMAGYAFFLRTSKEPSFEGFFQSRFAAKQLRLMKEENFDIDRYIKLRQAFSQQSSLPHHHFGSNSNSHCHCSSKSPCLH